MEQRLGIAPWPVAANQNNQALRRGAGVLGISSGEMQRNVKGCWNLGYCGMGCPTNAKQSMLVTTIPAALARGATLVTRARAWTIEHGNARASTLHCVGLDAGGTDPTARKITVRAQTFIVSAGAIGSPALLIRSKAPDPYGVVGKRTFLHPTVVSAALMPERVDGFAGAPQSVYSDHYLQLPADGPLGYKLEAPPLHPILVATTLPGHGVAHANWMRELAHMHVLIALMRDGFHTRSPGGSVGIDGDGSPVLDYRLDEFFWEGARRAFASMAEIQFAAGAKTVTPLHATAARYSSWSEAKAGIATLPLEPLQASVVSAHVMGGCPLGPDPKRAVTDRSGRHHHLENLYVLDGSLFPTSIGANPQLSIYGITAKLATELASQLKPRRLG
jgi:choline dehydrogenase-like flavoprotein